MEEKKYYITEDGRMFEDALRAKKHEDEITNEKMNRNRIIKLDNGKELGHDDIVEFFSKVRCSDCPFCKECHDMFHKLRETSTNTFNLCNAIQNECDDWDF